MTDHLDSQAPSHSAAPNLRKLVRSTRTKEFLTADGSWTTDITRALHIADFSDCQALCNRLNLRDVEAYYSFDPFRQSPYDFALPLHLHS